MSVNPISLSSREMVGALPRPAAEHPEISHLVLTFPSDGSQIDLAYFVSSLQARDRHPPPSFPGLSGGFLAFRGCLRGRPERCEMWLLGHVPPRSGGTRSASDAGGHPCHNPQPWPVPVPPCVVAGPPPRPPILRPVGHASRTGSCTYPQIFYEPAVDGSSLPMPPWGILPRRPAWKSS